MMTDFDPDEGSGDNFTEEMDAVKDDMDDIYGDAEDGWDLPENESLYMDNFKESDGLDVLGNISEHDLDEEFVDENVEGHHTPRKNDKSIGKVSKKRISRKDKGVPRLTAYMLWARETRPAIVQQNPNLDFSAVNKKLGELWQVVPSQQRLVWKRRAKRLVVRQRQSGMISTGKEKPAAKHGSAEAYLASPPSAAKSGSKAAATSATSPYKVVGTSAIDVAAHMKLLGESLYNIGYKLKEHEGQIAVSGSLSVLLDSMLCVLGPLLCLTDQVPATRGAIDHETHTEILDNIAYIMPGIV